MKLISILLLFFSMAITNAQTWSSGFVLGGSGNDVLTDIKGLTDGTQLAIFTYNASFLDQTAVFDSYGQSDLGVVHRNPVTGTILTSFSLGGPFSDTFGGIVEINGTYWLAGTFRTSLQSSTVFPDWTLVGRDEAAFLIELDEQLQPIDGQFFPTTGQVDVSAVAAADTSIYFAGEFTDSLQVGDTVLVSQYPQSWYVLELSPNGVFRRFWQGGFDENFFLTSLALAPNGDPLIGGHFDRQLFIGADTLISAADDFDVFLARLGTDDFWSQRLGGVQDDRCGELIVVNDTLWVAGSFVGLLVPSPSLQINTNGFDNDLFVLGYSLMGNPLFSRRYGGAGEDLFGQLIVTENELLVAAHAIGTTNIDGLTLGTPGGFTAFLAAFDRTGQRTWLAQQAGAPFVTGSHILATPSRNQYSLAGIYDGQLSNSAATFSSNGLNDWYVLEVAERVVPVHELDRPSAGLFPNPCSDFIFRKEGNWPLKTTLVNLSGQQFTAPVVGGALDVRHLPQGRYIIVETGVVVVVLD